jgi:hypothetical protein
MSIFILRLDARDLSRQFVKLLLISESISTFLYMPGQLHPASRCRVVISVGQRNLTGTERHRSIQASVKCIPFLMRLPKNVISFQPPPPDVTFRLSHALRRQRTHSGPSSIFPFWLRSYQSWSFKVGVMSLALSLMWHLGWNAKKCSITAFNNASPVLRLHFIMFEAISSQLLHAVKAFFQREVLTISHVSIF